jgi:hypothetical protein
MIRSLLSGILMLVGTNFIFSQSGLSNLNFETTSSFIGMGCTTPTPFPTGFNRSQATTNGLGWPAQYTLSPTAQSGTKYISIGNLNTCGHVDLQPVSFGMFGGNTAGNGSPYTTKPAQFCGFYRTQGISAFGDSVFVLVYLTKNGTLVGKGKWSTGSNQSAWTNFCANINYVSALTPDTVRIRFTPSNLLAGSTFSFTSQTIYMDVDNCSFTGSVTAISEMNSEASINSVMPNPFKDELMINVNSDHNLTAEIYNVLGSLERTVQIADGKNIINTSELRSGIYFIKVNTGARTVTTKIIKE